MPAIIILGGHRSGTSVTTRLVHELGYPAAPSPDRLLRPAPGHERDNPDGYFEDTAFVQLHRRMLGEHLKSLGGWINPRRDDAVVARLRPRYRELVRERHHQSADWCLKDPRLCLVGDLLLDLLAELRIEVKVVTTARPESQVVASLMRRGVPEAGAVRIAGVFEAGRQGILQRVLMTKLECLEVSFAGLARREDVEREVERLQAFLRPGDGDVARRLVEMVRTGP